VLGVRVLIVDDSPFIRRAVRRMLADDRDLEVVGEAGDGRAALRELAALSPDVITLDLRMPNGGGMAMLERLRDELPEIKALVVTASEKGEALLDAVAAGAAGYLTKRATRQELCQAVITVYGGGSVITPELAGHLLREYSRTSRGEASSLRPLLGSRERAILRLVAQGLTDKEIGQELYISPRTVQNHLTRIREKTGLRRRSELARWAVEHTVT
jgi:two-component system NarL family response regulator